MFKRAKLCIRIRMYNIYREIMNNIKQYEKYDIYRDDYELMKNIEYGCIYNKIVLTKFMKISNLKEQLQGKITNE